MAFLELWQEAWGSSQCATGTSRTSHVASVKSGLLSTCEAELSIPLEKLQGNWALSWVKAGNLSFLSSCDRILREPLELKKGNQAFFRVDMGNL